MKIILLLILILFSFSSCAAIINIITGYDECMHDGCDREAAKNCNYCGFHCQSYYPPAGFKTNVSKSIDKQTLMNHLPANHISK